MTEWNYRAYLRGESVHVKKYFYVLRLVLACRWIEAHRSMPLMEVDDLVADQLPRSLHAVVARLLRRKRAGDELESGPRITEINEFLGAELARLRETLASIPKRPKPDWSCWTISSETA